MGLFGSKICRLSIGNQHQIWQTATELQWPISFSIFSLIGPFVVVCVGIFFNILALKQKNSDLFAFSFLFLKENLCELINAIYFQIV